MSKRVTNMEKKIENSEERIANMEIKLKEERQSLVEMKKQLAHVKYNEVLKKLMAEGISPDDALQAIDLVTNSEENEVQGSDEKYD